MSDDKNFYSHGKWIRARNTRIDFDKRRCQVCGRQYKKTDRQAVTIDHIIMRRLLPEDQKYDIENLWTLCTCCNGIKQSLEHIFDDSQLKTITKSQWIMFIKRDKKYCKAKCRY